MLTPLCCKGLWVEVSCVHFHSACVQFASTAKVWLLLRVLALQRYLALASALLNVQSSVLTINVAAVVTYQKQNPVVICKIITVLVYLDKKKCIKNSSKLQKYCLVINTLMLVDIEVSRSLCHFVPTCFVLCFF